MQVAGPNIAAMVGRHNFAKAQATIDRALERLATGKRINRAGDDPSGMIAAQGLSSRRVTLEEMIKIQERASHMLDVTEGALSVVNDLAQELKSLTVTAANRSGLSGAEREALQVEAESLLDAIIHIYKNTRFGDKAILIEGAGMDVNGVWVNYGGDKLAGLGRTTVMVIDPETGKETPQAFTLHDFNGTLNLFDGDMEIAQQVADSFVQGIARQRAHIGSQQKYTYGHQLDALRMELESTASAESAIVDADYAEEVSTLIRGQVLREASMAVIEIARQSAARSLQLLQ